MRALWSTAGLALISHVRLLIFKNFTKGGLHQVVTPHGGVEARARLVGRESLPVAGDCALRPDALTPTLRFSPPGSPGARHRH